MGDWLHEICVAMVEAAAIDRALPPRERHALNDVERLLRKKYGATRHYIAKNAPDDRCDQRQRTATHAGGTSHSPPAN